MVENPNININKYERPTHILLSEMKDLHESFERLMNDFAVVCDRMEECAKRINQCGAEVSRSLFRDFMKAGVTVGNFVRFTDTDTPDAMYYVTDIDSEGFWLKSVPEGIEYQLRLLDNRDRISRIKGYSPNSSRVQRLREKLLATEIAERTAPTLGEYMEQMAEGRKSDAE